MATPTTYTNANLDVLSFVCDTITVRSGRLAASWFNTSDLITYDHIVHEKAITYGQAHGAAIAAKTEVIYIATAAGTVESVEAVITGVIPGADTVTVDIQKSTGGGAFATILSAAISFTSGTTTIRVPLSGTISSGTFVDGDVLAVVVTASGSTAQGLGVTVNLSQFPTP